MTLADTKGRGVDRITTRGAVVDGREYELDCVIYATGFTVGVLPYESGEYTVVGRGGVDLATHWGRGSRDDEPPGAHRAGRRGGLHLRRLPAGHEGRRRRRQEWAACYDDSLVRVAGRWPIGRRACRITWRCRFRLPAGEVAEREAERATQQVEQLAADGALAFLAAEG